MTVCLAVHVADEGLGGFLGVCNSLVRSLHARLAFFPFPTFTFKVWLTGLTLAVWLPLALSVLAFRGARWMIPLAFVFAALMLLNGLAHIGGSLYMQHSMPAVYSAPPLLAGSVYLLAQAWAQRVSVPQSPGRGRPL